MPLYETLLDCIGRTPLVRLSAIAGDCPAALVGKIEMLNPGGSIKDRIGLAMVAAAERDGLLKSGATIVEATAGNTGVALAMVAAVRGYECVFVLPEKISRDKEELLCAYGAEVIRTPNASPGHRDHFQEVARRLAQENGWFWPNQFGNAANPEIHYRTTGPEIWEDTGGQVDAFVCGVGTGGTLTGVGRYLKERSPHLKVILADPVGSTLGGGVSGSYHLEGIGQSMPPANFDAAMVDEAIYVSDADAFLMARRLAREAGMLVGGTAGCAAVAALRYGMRPENAGKTIVAILPDTGRNYLSKIYNSVWMQANGFENLL